MVTQGAAPVPEAANRPASSWATRESNSLSKQAGNALGKAGAGPRDGAAVLLAQERFEVVGIAGKKGSITVDVLRQHFHLPLNNVAHKFGMCSTAFKKMCRRLGILKWPHRQLRGIEKKISVLKAELSSPSNSQDREENEAELALLQEEKAKLLRKSWGGSSKGECESDSSPSSATGSGGSPISKAVTFLGAGVSVPSLVTHDASENEEGSASDADSSAGDSHDVRPEAHAMAGMPGSIVVTQRELRNNFHLPLNTVASKFCMCSTAFKKMCRRFGIAKWPHRKLRGIDKRIAALKAELKYAKDQEKVNYTKCLESLIQEKHRLTMGSDDEGLEGAASRTPSTSSEAHSAHSSPPPSKPLESSSQVQIRNLLCDEDAEEDADDAEGKGSDDDKPEGSKSEAEGDEAAGGGGGAATSRDISRQVLRHNITAVVLQQHYHLALHVVANKFGMCATAFKKLCRRFGIAKWPHRKLRGIDRKIAAFKAEIKYAKQGDTTYHRGLARLEEEKALLCSSASMSCSRSSSTPAPSPPASQRSTLPSRAEQTSHHSVAPGLDVLASVIGKLPHSPLFSLNTPPVVAAMPPGVVAPLNTPPVMAAMAAVVPAAMLPVDPLWRPLMSRCSDAERERVGGSTVLPPLSMIRSALNMPLLCSPVMPATAACMPATGAWPSFVPRAPFA